MVDTLLMSATLHTMMWFVPVAGALLTSLFLEQRCMFVAALVIGIVLI